MRKTQQPQYSIENPSPTMNSENYPLLKPTINKNTGNKTEKSNNPSTKKLAQELHKYDFIDTGYLDNATISEKDRAIALSI